MESRSTWAFLIWVMLLALPAPARPRPLSLPQVNAVVSRVVPHGSPGMVVAVLNAHGLVHLRAYGMADLETHKPVTTDTLFDLASLSKQFTAVAILLLVQDHRMNLNDDVRRYLPELPRYDPSTPIRVKDLLHMTSGLNEYATDGAEVADPGRMTNTDVLREVAAYPRLAFPTGARFEYTNSNYVLLALILERITHMPFREFVRQRIFVPLGMAHTQVQDAHHHVKGAATGYRANGNGFTKDYLLVTPTGDGNVFSTAEDMVLWARALRQRRLLSHKLWHEAFTNHRLVTGELTGYGYGFCVDYQYGHRCIWHDGGVWAGTSSYLAWYPEDSLTILALSNVTGQVTDDLMGSLAELFL